VSGHFTRLVLHNWRNFESVDVELTERVFVVGPNASGKSNLLDAFRFLQELAIDGGGLTNALEGAGRGGIRRIRSLHAKKNSQLHIEVEAEVDGDKWRYLLKLEATGPSHRPGPASVVEERVWLNRKVKLKRPDEDDERDPELLLATALEQRSANAGFRPLRDFLRSLDYIHVVPQLVRQAKADDTGRFGKGLGAGLVESIHVTPKKQQASRLRRIELALKLVLPQFDKLETFQDPGGRPHLRARYRHWRPQGVWQDESAFSDGTVRLIGLLWYLSGGNTPLLLEEPELSLHPAAVRQIPRVIAPIVRRTGRQVLMSTHSMDLLSDKGIDPSEVIVLETTASSTKVLSGSKIPELVEAAAADLPLGPAIDALTRPPGLQNLPRFGEAR